MSSPSPTSIGIDSPSFPDVRECAEGSIAGPVYCMIVAFGDAYAPGSPKSEFKMWGLPDIE